MTAKLLVVDDSTAVHSLVAACLCHDHFNLCHAEDGAAGLRLAVTSKPDLILLDVDLPDMNGFEVCKQLKADPRTRRIGVVFLTAASTGEDRVRGLEMSAVDYIVKPFDPRELSLRVHSALRSIRMSYLLGESSEDDENAGSKRDYRIPRLKLGQVIEARAKNPWHRVPPTAVASSAAG